MKSTIGNFISFIIGIYFIIRAVFYFLDKTGDVGSNKFISYIYFFIGISFIIIQIFANYKRKNKKDDEN